MEKILIGTYHANNNDQLLPVLVNSSGVLLTDSFYLGAIRRTWSNTNLPAGTSNQNDSAVPAGQSWLIENFYATYTGTITNVQLHLAVVSGGTEFRLAGARPPLTGLGISIQCSIILTAGTNLRVVVIGATAGDDLAAWAVGRLITL